jgi:hypothetical protein
MGDYSRGSSLRDRPSAHHSSLSFPSCRFQGVSEMPHPSRSAPEGKLRPPLPSMFHKGPLLLSFPSSMVLMLPSNTFYALLNSFIIIISFRHQLNRNFLHAFYSVEKMAPKQANKRLTTPHKLSPYQERMLLSYSSKGQVVKVMRKVL